MGFGETSSGEMGLNCISNIILNGSFVSDRYLVRQNAKNV